MPEWLAVILLGVIEGVTEFLPISSTGHLLLVENSHLLPGQSDLFNITIQSGAALAVLAVFGGRLRDLLARVREPAAGGYLAKLLLAFVITGAGGLAVKRLGFVLPKEVAPIAWATLIGGVVILLVEWGLRGRSARSEVTWAVAVAVGLAQLLAAVFPGTSRAAATIMIAMLLGLARPAATEFSFLVGVPTLIAAGGFETLHALRHPAGPPTKWGMLALGTVVSALTAFVVVRWLLRWIQTHSFVPFGWYRIALGLLMLARFV
ncbi:MAG TPA: undecaprenyl-diphosphate phosphatase [Methylomirabilota bacterium]|jgi:undecaprenyl-diphosphatase|nr:undecaprenyl-diphosphate phosphatase [Methylomirabilota bacterium]